MPLLLLLGICALATWWVIADAQRRNLNPRLWGTLTALTTGLALPVYLVMRGRRRA